eukprot:635352-Rhodomonas_salina.3
MGDGAPWKSAPTPSYTTHLQPGPRVSQRSGVVVVIIMAQTSRCATFARTERTNTVPHVQRTSAGASVRAR